MGGGNDVEKDEGETLSKKPTHLVKGAAANITMKRAVQKTNGGFCIKNRVGGGVGASLTPIMAPRKNH